MNYQLEHVAIYCKDLDATIKFYEKFFGGQPTAIRKGDAGYAFCFMRIAGSPAIQLMESATGVGVHHYGFITTSIRCARSSRKRAQQSCAKTVMRPANSRPSSSKTRTD